MIDLAGLIERLEKATGPDIELDADIYGECALRPTLSKKMGNSVLSHLKETGDFQFPEYTSSIDAALTLVPEGWRIYSVQDQRHFQVSQGFFVGLDKIHAAPAASAKHEIFAIALCIAALKARAATT